MTSASLANLSPPIHRGVKKINKADFEVDCQTWTVLFKDPKNIGVFLKNFRDQSLQIPRIPFIICLSKKEVPTSYLNATDLKNRKLKAVVLNEKVTVTDNDVKTTQDDSTYIPEKLSNGLSQSCIDFVAKAGGIYKLHKLTFGYDYWKSDEILKAVLPEELLEDVPSSFTKAGHLAHLNLKNEYKPYDSIIGQVILDKNPSITTVVDKVDTVGNEFRTFKMKVIAGKPDFMVTQRESGCDFTFDFSKVYWNSRLSTEHDRLIQGFKKGTAICDVMAGVGPFAIPAAKKGCIAFANDLNPESYKYLKRNIVSNKVKGIVIPYNVDGAQLIKDSPKMLMEFTKKFPTIKIETHPNGHNKRRKISETKVPHFFAEYAMNLPGAAMTFVHNYIGLFANAFPDMTKEQVKSLPDYRLPIVHVYHFEKFSPDEKPQPNEEQLEKRMHKQVCECLKYDIPLTDLSFHLVRKVAPTKPMYCISFTLPEAVAFAKV